MPKFLPLDEQGNVTESKRRNEFKLLFDQLILAYAAYYSNVRVANNSNNIKTASTIFAENPHALYRYICTRYADVIQETPLVDMLEEQYKIIRKNTKILLAPKQTIDPAVRRTADVEYSTAKTRVKNIFENHFTELENQLKVVVRDKVCNRALDAALGVIGNPLTTQKYQDKILRQDIISKVYSDFLAGKTEDVIFDRTTGEPSEDSTTQQVKTRKMPGLAAKLSEYNPNNAKNITPMQYFVYCLRGPMLTALSLNKENTNTDSLSALIGDGESSTTSYEDQTADQNSAPTDAIAVGDINQNNFNMFIAKWLHERSKEGKEEAKNAKELRPKESSRVAKIRSNQNLIRESKIQILFSEWSTLTGSLGDFEKESPVDILDGQYSKLRSENKEPLFGNIYEKFQDQVIKSSCSVLYVDIANNKCADFMKLIDNSKIEMSSEISYIKDVFRDEKYIEPGDVANILEGQRPQVRNYIIRSLYASTPIDQILNLIERRRSDIMASVIDMVQVDYTSMAVTCDAIIEECNKTISSTTATPAEIAKAKAILIKQTAQRNKINSMGDSWQQSTKDNEERRKIATVRLNKKDAEISEAHSAINYQTNRKKQCQLLGDPDGEIPAIQDKITEQENNLKIYEEQRDRLKIRLENIINPEESLRNNRRLLTTEERNILGRRMFVGANGESDLENSRIGTLKHLTSVHNYNESESESPLRARSHNLTDLHRSMIGIQDSSSGILSPIQHYIEYQRELYNYLVNLPTNNLTHEKLQRRLMQIEQAKNNITLSENHFEPAHPALFDKVSEDFDYERNPQNYTVHPHAENVTYEVPDKNGNMVTYTKSVPASIIFSWLFTRAYAQAHDEFMIDQYTDYYSVDGKGTTIKEKRPNIGILIKKYFDELVENNPVARHQKPFMYTNFNAFTAGIRNAYDERKLFIKINGLEDEINKLRSEQSSGATTCSFTEQNGRVVTVNIADRLKRLMEEQYKSQKELEDIYRHGISPIVENGLINYNEAIFTGNKKLIGKDGKTPIGKGNSYSETREVREAWEAKVRAATYTKLLCGMTWKDESGPDFSAPGRKILQSTDQHRTFAELTDDECENMAELAYDELFKNCPFRQLTFNKTHRTYDGIATTKRARYSVNMQLATRAQIILALTCEIKRIRDNDIVEQRNRGLRQRIIDEHNNPAPANNSGLIENLPPKPLTNEEINDKVKDQKELHPHKDWELSLADVTGIGMVPQNEGTTTEEDWARQSAQYEARRRVRPIKKTQPIPPPLTGPQKLSQPPKATVQQPVGSATYDDTNDNMAFLTAQSKTQFDQLIRVSDKLKSVGRFVEADAMLARAERLIESCRKN